MALLGWLSMLESQKLHENLVWFWGDNMIFFALNGTIYHLTFTYLSESTTEKSRSAPTLPSDAISYIIINKKMKAALIPYHSSISIAENPDEARSSGSTIHAGLLSKLDSLPIPKPTSLNYPSFPEPNNRVRYSPYRQ